MTTSGMFSLAWRDVGKGLLLAVISAVVTHIYEATALPGFSFLTIDWGATLTIGGIAAISYLVKNFFTDSQGKFGGVL